VQCDDWYQCIPVVLWAYQTTYKKITKNTPFRLVYDKEVIISLEFVIPNLHISLATHMNDEQSLQHRLDKLMELEEDRLVVGFNQVVEK
jgi:hypothetical protein